MHEVRFELLDHQGDDIIQFYCELHVFLDLLLFVQEYFQEAFVHLNVLTEDQDRDFLLQAGADFVEKLVQLLLLLLRALSEDQEFSHFLLEVCRQVKLLHGSVSYVDLVLELSLLGSAAFNQNSHVSKQGGIDDSHCNKDCGTDQDFHVCSWAHLIPTQEEYSIVVVHNISVE